MSKLRSGVGVLRYPANDPVAHDLAMDFAKDIYDGCILVLPNTLDDTGSYAWDFRIERGPAIECGPLCQVITRREDTPSPRVECNGESITLEELDAHIAQERGTPIKADPKIVPSRFAKLESPVLHYKGITIRITDGIFAIDDADDVDTPIIKEPS